MNQDIESMFNGTVQETADARDAVSDVISENSKLNGDFESSGNIEIRGTVTVSYTHLASRSHPSSYYSGKSGGR